MIRNAPLAFGPSGRGRRVETRRWERMKGPFNRSARENPAIRARRALALRTKAHFHHRAKEALINRSARACPSRSFDPSKRPLSPSAPFHRSARACPSRSFDPSKRPLSPSAPFHRSARENLFLANPLARPMPGAAQWTSLQRGCRDDKVSA